MKKTAILTLSKTRKIFKPAYISQEYGNISVLTVKNNVRAISRLKKSHRETDFLILHGEENEKIWKNKCKIKKGICYKTALPVLEKICRQVAVKYGITLPFSEIYVQAAPPVACIITTCLSGLSRVFTVISEESPLVSAYDELYFKHGTIIRHLPEFNNNISDDSIIIRCCEDELPLWAEIPVIDFSGRTDCGKISVKPEDIYVCGDNIRNLAKLWGGKTGLEFYELIGEVPGIDADIDINISADKIFLLDTDGF